MPKYAALIYRLEAEHAWPGTPEFQELRQAWGAFNPPEGMLTTGIGLKASSTATVVKVRDGKTVTTDGPFAETREQLGGVFVLECADLDEAIHWASQIPDASRGGYIELRPLWGE
jgi:hypothetical protein